ncbi:Cu(I)-responsive transcriptional regulator [Peredibacter sp. HCB2-198]|uniref:Cu(I)-responsive transcriptional regulator n=1 Tax=Peredibacter sp. HCB2-198 TaxID=3383025 RepID=UPI0038B5D063
MNIGELASMSDVNAKMIRRYEENGIIPKAGRSLSGYRQYSEKDVHVLKFVKRARELGFSMKDIKQLLSLWRNKSRPSSQVKSLALKHKKELEMKLKEIQEMLHTINNLVEHCHGDDRPDCPILDGLDCHK